MSVRRVRKVPPGEDGDFSALPCLPSIATRSTDGGSLRSCLTSPRGVVSLTRGACTLFRQAPMSGWPACDLTSCSSSCKNSSGWTYAKCSATFQKPFSRAEPQRLQTRAWRMLAELCRCGQIVDGSPLAIWQAMGVG